MSPTALRIFAFLLSVLAAASAGLAQSAPALTQPTPAQLAADRAAAGAAAAALAKLPRYGGARIIFADRNQSTHTVVEALQRVPPQFICEGQPLKAVLDRFARETNTNLSVQWAALEKAGVDRTTPVSLALAHVSYHEILALLLASIAQAREAPAYQVQDGVIIISTEPVFDAHRQFISYDLGQYVTAFFKRSIPPQQQEQSAAALAALVRQIIAPDQWQDGANKLARFHGTLIVNAPPRIQLQVQQFLADVQSPTRPPETPPTLKQSDNRLAAGQSLEKPFPDRSVSGVLGAALQQIQNVAGLNMFVDSRACAAAGIAPESRIAIDPKAGSLQGRPAGSVLEETLRGVTGKAGVLDFALDDEGVVQVSTADVLAAQTIVAVYDLRDWIKRQQFRAAEPKPTAEDLITPVIAGLKQTVAPATWDKTAAMENFQGLLVVSATPRHQRMILEKLTKLIK